VFVLALALALSACALGDAGGDAEFAIVAPTEGERVGTNAVRIQGVVGDPSIRSVLVNGEPVSVSAGEFQSTLRLEDGPVRIEAAAGALVDVVNIYVDGRAPHVVIDEPAPGSFIEGTTLLVRGHVEDATDATVTVDGEPVSVDASGAFTYERTVAPGAHRVRVVAEDSVGHVGSTFTSAIVGHFGDAEDPLPRAVSLALGEAALDAVGMVAAPHMSPENVRPLVMAANPIADGFWGEVHTTGENHDPVNIELKPGDDALGMTITVPNLAVPFEVNLPLGFDVTGTTYVDTAIIDASAAVGASGGMPIIDLASSEVTLEGVFIDVDGLWDWVDRALVTNALRGTIESSLNDAVANEVPSALEAALAELPSSHELELQGYRAEIMGAVADLTATNAGLRAVLDFGVRPIGGAGPAMLAAPGPLVMGAGQAPDSALQGVEGGVTVDLLNAALHAAWGVGGLSYRMDTVMGPGDAPLNVGLVNIILPVEGAPRDAPISVEVEAALPPVVQPTATGLEMHAADLHVKLYAPGESGEVLLANISCGVRAAVAPILAEDGLGLAVEELEVTIDGIGELTGLPPAADLDRILGDLLAPMLEEHGQLRGFAIPTVAGFDVGAEAVYVEEGYVVFQGSLSAH